MESEKLQDATGQLFSHKCQFCDQVAKYDGKTKFGPWAYMCLYHFNTFGIRTKGLYTNLEDLKRRHRENERKQDQGE